MADVRSQKKQIIPTSLNFKDIKPSFGATWKQFTVYEVTGNDGIKYETTDKVYYESFKIGVPVEIEYEVVSKPSNGRVFTSYRLIGPVREKPETQRVMDRILQVESNILSEMRRMEKNIIKAIELNARGAEVSIGEDDFPPVDPADLGGKE